MDVRQHFESLSNELNAVKNRVRHLLSGEDYNNWQTDGEWKESALRTVLNRHLPNSVEALRGFILTEDASSTQIDILLYDNSKPVLFRDGNLVFVTPDAVLGIIEVKSSIGSLQRLNRTLAKLADNTELAVNPNLGGYPHVNFFSGLFAYENDLANGGEGEILEGLYESAEQDYHRVVNHVTVGSSVFARFWDRDPEEKNTGRYHRWHLYELQDLAFGYFINNVIHAVSDMSVSMNRSLYFPEEGKEGDRVGTFSLGMEQAV